MEGILRHKIIRITTFLPPLFLPTLCYQAVKLGALFQNYLIYAIILMKRREKKKQRGKRE